MKRSSTGMIQIAAPVLGLLLAFELRIAAEPLECISGRIQFPNGKETRAGYFVLPKKGAPHPGLILLHDEKGLQNPTETSAERIARQGFVVLAVEWNPGGSDQEAAQSMEAGLKYLRSRPEVKTESVGVVGWGRGGDYAYHLAVRHLDLKACVTYYGKPPRDRDDLLGIQAPVLAFFGRKDLTVPPAAVDQFLKDMRSLDKKVTVQTFANAGRFFSTAPSPGRRQQKFTQEAWEKTLAFLKKSLQ